MRCLLGIISALFWRDWGKQQQAGDVTRLFYLGPYSNIIPSEYK